MPHPRRRAAAITLVLLVGPVAGIGPATAAIAPPAASQPRGGEQGSTALDANTDARLAQAVPSAIHAEPLDQALRALTERTGVKLEASREVAESRVTLIGRDLPLHRVLTELAALLDLTWTRRGTAPGYRYECARGREATQRATAALEQARVRNRATVQGQLTRVAEAIRKGDTSGLAASDPEIAAALDDPARSAGTRGVFQGIAGMPPQGTAWLVQAGKITATYDQMPPQAQENIRKQLDGFLPLALGNVRGPDGNSPGYDAFLKSASYTLGVNGLDYGGNTYFGEIRAGELSLRYGVDLGTATVPPTSAPGAPMPPAADTATARSRRPLPPIPATLDGGKSMSVREITEWLASHAPLTVVSDYYATRYERPNVPIPPKATAETALLALEKYGEMDVNVGADERVLRLRSRRWPLDDLMEPPAAVVEALARAQKANGRLGLPEYLFAAQLTDAQGGGLGRIENQRYSQLAGALDGSRPLVKSALRLTAALSPAQRAAAEAPTGLPAVQLTAPQRALFAETVSRQIADARPDELAAATFHLRRDERPSLGAPAGSAPMETYLFQVALPGPRQISARLTVGPARK